MKKPLAIILVLACCLALMACSSGEVILETTESTQAQQTNKPTADSTSNAPTQATQPAATQPQQSMCYWCGEVPVGDFESYCVNCRCLKCDNLRKSGSNYLYCSKHNCNESYCEQPAFDDSQYCTEHKCSNPNCDNRRWSGSVYCAHHK